jgi:hypothetical protein
MAQYIDRYAKYKDNGEMIPLPGITITKSDSDRQYVYKQGLSRLDKVSLSYYNTPYYGWLILLANPEYGGLEFNIPDTTVLRIPYPLNDGIQRYNNELNKHIRLYGL